MTFLGTKKPEVITENSMTSNGMGILVTEVNMQYTLLLENDMNHSVKKD